MPEALGGIIRKVSEESFPVKESFISSGIRVATEVRRLWGGNPTWRGPAKKVSEAWAGVVAGVTIMGYVREVTARRLIPLIWR